jgi:hypothetical protein
MASILALWDGQALIAQMPEKKDIHHQGQLIHCP